MRSIFYRTVATICFGYLFCLQVASALPVLAGWQDRQSGKPGQGTGGNTRQRQGSFGNNQGDNKSRRPGGAAQRPSGNRPGNGKPVSNRPQRPASRPPRPLQWGRPPRNRPSYRFRPNDRDFLRRHYRSHLSYINRARRPVFTVGGYFAYDDIPYLTPVPSSLIGYIQPPPPGYRVGYFDGYVVVYDPLTYFIADLVDLLQ